MLSTPFYSSIELSEAHTESELNQTIITPEKDYRLSKIHGILRLANFHFFLDQYEECEKILHVCYLFCYLVINFFLCFVLDILRIVLLFFLLLFFFKNGL